LFEILHPPWENTHAIIRNALEAFKGKAETCGSVWFSRFKKGDLSIEDQPRSGRHSSSRDEKITKIREKPNEDRRYTIDELSEVTGVSWSSVQRILTQDLGMRRVAAKFVPRLLTEDQRKSRLAVCQDLKRELENDPNFLSRVITGDESWCYGYDPESK
jgi:histone-lysine N-methyltransferase SETMAR